MKTKYVFAFCNRLKLNMWSYLCCVLEDVLTTPVLKTLQYLQKNIRDGEFDFKEAAVSRVTNEVLRQICFLGI